MYSQGYFIDVQICITMLYLVYITLLHQHISNTIARRYLLLMLPVGLVIPLLNLPLLPASELLLPAPIVDRSEMILAENMVVESATSVDYLSLLYFIGLGVMAVWTLIGFVKLFLLFRHHHIERIGKSKVIFIKQESYAYTIMNFIFINEKFRNTPTAKELIAHETEHIRLGHTYDLIYISIMRVLFWFNPAVWHTQRLLRQIHEYQVDSNVIKKGYSLKSYVNLLIMSEAGISPEFTAPFGYSFTKKRIAMLLKKNQTNRRRRLLVTIPVLAALLLAFSVTTRASVESSAENGIQKDTIMDIGNKSPKRFLEFLEENDAFECKLIIIDGVASTEKQMKDLDINRIESITILKNEAAIKVFGIAAKDGVIVIELKKDEVTVKNDEVTIKSDKKSKVSTVNLTYKKQLVIIDGFEQSYEAYSKLSVNQIKQLTVLDAETGEKIYGKMAANGVIIIETNALTGQPSVVVKGIKEATFSSDGTTDFRSWVQQRVKYPKESMDKKSSGIVLIGFYVEKNGKIGDIVQFEGIDKLLANEVIRVIKSSPKWSPAIEDGVAVRSQQSVRIVFAI